MDSSSSLQIPSHLMSNLREMFKEIDAKKLGKKGIQKLNENAPLLMDVTKSICEVAGQAPLVGICFKALGIIIQTAADYTEIDEKAKEVIEYANFLKESMETIANAGGDDEYLRKHCLALLCADAFKFENQNPREQRWAKCMCGFLCAQCESRTLDGLATRLRDMNQKLSLHCATIILNQAPKPSQAPLADSSLKLNNKEELLKFVTEPGVRVLALCGMGGLGKTTLLTALHQDFPKKNNQAKAFIEVGKNPANLMQIQTEILQGLENKNETFRTTQQGRARLLDCLKGLKERGSSLCLSIDNVWRAKDLNELLPEKLHVHLPESSCLMISSRSQVVAEEFRVICCPKNASSYQFFQPSLLDTQEAKELFIQWAEIEDEAKERKLINEIVPLCAGLPLAIKTYGKHFRTPKRRQEAQWTKVKQRILASSSTPSTADNDDEVPRSLEASIDVQEEDVQNAFIDAALFWRGKPLEMARSALYVGDEDILEVLLEDSIIYSKKSIIYFDNAVGYTYSKALLILDCHDLFFAIAEKRAKRNCWKYLATPKMQVLKDGTRVRAIDIPQDIEFQTLHKNLLYLRAYGILTNPDAHSPSQDKKHDLKALYLSRQPNLSLLHLQCFPNLQVLSITEFEYPGQFPQVRHQLPSSLFENLSNLRFIEIDGSNEPLDTLPNSFGNLVHLQTLKLSFFSCLITLPAFSKPLTSLKELMLIECAQLARLPDTLGPLPALTSLNLTRCAQLARLPDTLGPLPALTSLDLFSCAQLAHLPDTLGPLPALTSLDLSWCVQLACLPDTLGPLPALTSLGLSKCAQLARLPDTLGPLPALTSLGLSLCDQLACLPDTLGPLPALTSLVLYGCAKLTRLPDTLGPLPALTYLDLSGCAQLTRLPDTLGPLPALTELHLSACAQLARLPDTLGPLPALTYLDLSGCAQLARLPDTLGPLPALEMLEYAGCTQLLALLDKLAARLQ